MLLKHGKCKTGIARMSTTVFVKGCSDKNASPPSAKLEEVLDRLDQKAIQIDAETYGSLLRACNNVRALHDGKRVHAHIIRNGLESDVFLGGHLVQMYLKCQSLVDAEQVFHRIPHRSVVLWTAMIGAYAESGHFKQALQVYHKMQLEGAAPDGITFITILNACANPSAVEVGKLIHVHIVARRFEESVKIGNALVNMYGKCGCIQAARCVFERMPERNVITWTGMITAYAQNGHNSEAFQCFREMQLGGFAANAVTFVNILNACLGSTNMEEGMFVHALVMEAGFEGDIVVSNALVNMYGKSGNVDDARRIFDEGPQQTVISWNTMIGVYTQHDRCEEALELLRQMVKSSFVPDKVTCITALTACTSLAALADGKLIHKVVKDTGLESDIVIGNALLNMYGKCGSLEDAVAIFEQVKQDVVSCNAMIGAYAHQGHWKDALRLFHRMQLDGLVPDKVTFAAVLDGCGSLAALAEGKLIHALVVESGYEPDVVVGTALVNMYGKCGCPETARRMFDKMPRTNELSWNSLFGAYAHRGHTEEVLHLFKRMQQEGGKVHIITFVCILNACSHAGILEECLRHFASMAVDYRMMPKSEHYGCIVDLLGRLGQLEEAEKFIKRMPFQPNDMIWMSLLSACRTHNDLDRAKRAAKHVMELDPQRSASYVVLSNIYAALGKWDDVARMRQKMIDMGIKKEPGCSSIEVNNRVHEFSVRDLSHSRTVEIYAEMDRWNSLMKEAGYATNTKSALNDVEEEMKEHLICYHSEKLAIAFGLISTPSGTPLRVINNLRVCGNCHTATKFISKVSAREITVRDANRFHHFKDGTCSCRDYW